MDILQNDYPWTKAPLIAGAPMRLISLTTFAVEISRARGLGFIGAGNDATNLANRDLASVLEEVKTKCADISTLTAVKDVLPVGVGFLCWAGEKLLQDCLPALEKYVPAAVWFFAPNNNDELVRFTEEVRRVTQGKTKVWIQVGSVANALEVTKTCHPDVIVVQGHDAGGHGFHYAAGLIPLFPEVNDAVTDLCSKENIRRPVLVAAGGIVEPRTAAAALSLGASGLVMGTRYLASPEASIMQGYRDDVLASSDGGQQTDRTKLYDQLRGTTDWPDEYGGRSLLNRSYYDHADGMSIEENKRLYEEALKKGDAGWGEQGRLTTYAGTGVGLMRKVQGAAEITEEIRDGAKNILAAAAAKFQRRRDGVKS
jgi:nitronate monooxygenase